MDSEEKRAETLNQEIFIHVLLQLDETMKGITLALERIAQRMEEEIIKQ